MRSKLATLLCLLGAFWLGGSKLMAKADLDCRLFATQEKYRYHLNGNDGFRYRIIETAESIRCLDENGVAFVIRPLLSAADRSPLYDGWRFEDSGSITRVRVSFQQLKSQSRLETAEPLQWAEGNRRLGVFVGNEDLLQFLLAQPERFYREGPASTPERARLMQQILFGDEIHLDFETLEDIGRKASRSQPAPIAFEFPMKYFASGLLVESQISVQINEIDLRVKERSVRFDYETDRISVELEADRVSLRGPIQNKLNIAPLWLDRSLVYPSANIYLDEGWVDYVRLSFQLMLERTAEDVWSLALVPGTFIFSFSPPSDSAEAGKEEPALFYYEASIELPDGTRQRFHPSNFIPFVRADPDEILSKPITQDEIDVQGQLQSIFESSVTQRFFAESFQLALPLFRGEHEAVLFQLADLDIRRDGLMLYYDFLRLPSPPATCIAEVFEPRAASESPSLERVPIVLSEEKAQLYQKAQRPADRARMRQWRLEWKRDNPERWSLGLGELSQSTQRVQWAASLEGMNELLYEFWRAGLFCWGTNEWRSRPASFPWMEVVGRESPRFEIFEEELFFHWSASLRLFERSYETSNESFVFREALDFFSTWSLQWSEDSILSLFQTNFGLMDEPDSAESAMLYDQSQALLIQLQESLPDFMGQDAEGRATFLHEALVDTLTDSLGLERKSFHFETWGWRADQPDRLTLDLRADWAPLLEDWIAREGSTDSASEERQRESAATSLERPPLKTVLLSDPIPFEIQESRLRIEWGQEFETDERILYSYALSLQSDPSTAPEELWSSWSEERSREFILTQPGRYFLRIKAMNLDFEIESGPGLELSFYFKGNPIKGEGAGLERQEDTWALAQRPERQTGEQEAAPSEVQPARSRGPFGCQLRQQESPLPVGALSFLVAALLLSWRRRCRRINLSP